jgi:hypothetical protein
MNISVFPKYIFWVWKENAINNKIISSGKHPKRTNFVTKVILDL